MITFFVFVLGTCIGSFLSVCVHRIPQQKSIIKPESHCPYCYKSIPLYLNIPIIGFIISRAKCFNCKTKISFLYPILEILCGLAFILLFLKLESQNTNLTQVIQKTYFLYFSFFFFFVKRKNKSKLPNIYFDLSFLILNLSFLVQENYLFLIFSIIAFIIHKAFYREWFSYNLLLLLQIINPIYLSYLLFNILLRKNIQRTYLLSLINIFLLFFS